MIRTLAISGIFGLLLMTSGCTNCCRRPEPPCPAPTKILVPPPPTAPAPLVPAGAMFAPPTQPFPTAPQPTAGFGLPDAPFPKAPPSMTPLPFKDPQPRYESKWQAGENPDARPDAKPRVQLYAPEPTDKEKPRVTEEPPFAKKPGSTFPAIAQFAEVKANVYTGLRPGSDGLNWLQTNRLGTVVQIMPPDFDDSADQKEVEARGMRYAAVKVSPQNLTKEGFDGFIKLIRESSEKGVFVFDRDGSLAAPMWYLYLRWGEFLDDDAAQLRARSLGLQTNRDGAQREMWLAVQKLLSENNP